MRAPHAELLAAQKTGAITPLVKLDIDSGSYTYYKGTLLRGEYSEQVYDHHADLTLENRDGTFDDLDFKGLLATLSFGATTAGGDKYSAVAPMWVLRHSFDSAPKQKFLYLYMVGLPNLLLEDRASVNYQPASSDTKTIKDIFNAVANGQTPMYPVWQASTTYTKGTVVRKVSSNGYAYECTVGGDSGGGEPSWTTTLGATFVDNEVTWLCTGKDNPYSHCAAITVTWDSEDSLIDSYILADAFSIYKGASRLGTLRQLVDYTKCIMRFEADGEIHIRVPVVSGGSYDETYDFDTGGKHPFFSKAYRQAFVIPNKVQVDSRVGDSPIYTGVATSAASFALVEKWQFESAFLASDAQAVALAEAIIAKAEMSTDGGSVYAKIMNTAQELYDYILVEDTRQGDSRDGNVGSIVRRFNVPTGQFDMTLTFGAWLSIRQEINNLEAYPSGFGSGVNFSRLTVGDLDATNITAENLDMTSVTLDTIGDGTVYKRMLAAHLDAGVFQMTDAVTYAAGFDPRDKFDLNDHDFDNIPEGSTYQRVLSTQINAGKILLSDAMDYSIGYNPNDKTRTFTSEPTTPYAIGDLWVADGVVKRCNEALNEGAYNAAHWTVITMDDIANGSTYSRVATASLTAEGLVLLDQVSTGTYGLVKASDISAGSIKLWTTEESSAARLVSDNDKGVWNEKTVTFAQDGIPTSLAIGDIWMDTNDDNKLYRAASIGADQITAGEWILLRDAGIAAAIASAASAQSTADGKIVSFYQDAEPAGGSSSVGDIWIDTNDGNNQYRYNGSAWVDVQDGGIATAIGAAAGAQSTADGRIVTFYQTSAPTATAIGDLWVDTNDGNKLYRASATGSGNWVEVPPDLVNAIKTGEWYSSSGVEIDATHGINIYGENNALTTRATKAGTIQCSVDSSGAITAGAGAVTLDANGINIYGTNNALTTRATKAGTIQCSVDSSGAITAGAGTVTLDVNGITIAGRYVNFKHGATTKGAIYSDGDGFKVLSDSPYDLIIQGHPIRMNGDTNPYTSGAVDLGSPSAIWRNSYATPILKSTYYGSLVDGMLSFVGDGSGDLLVYDNSGWRYTYDHTH